MEHGTFDSRGKSAEKKRGISGDKKRAEIALTINNTRVNETFMESFGWKITEHVICHFRPETGSLN